MASDESSSPNGRYLYSVIPAEAVDSLKLEVDGIDGADVYPLVVGSLAAIVSDLEEQKLRPERKNLSAHSAVLRKLMDQSTLLPVAFGIVAKDERDIRDLLADHEREMLDQLERVKDKVEMGLRGTLRVPDVFQFFIEKFPELRERRDETFAGGEPSREAKIELGQLFSELLQDLQDDYAAQAEERLRQVGEVRVSEPRSEEEMINLSVLVARGELGSFREAIEALAPDLDEHIDLQVSGPWPPYNFVELRIESMEEDEEEGEEAR